MILTKKLYLILLFFSAISLKAQEISLDSNYVNQVIQLAQTESDEALLFDQMENALLVARSINYPEGKAFVVEWLAQYYREKNDNIAALRYYLELLEGQNKKGRQSSKNETLFEIAQIYHKEKLEAKALEYYHQLLPFSTNKSSVWESMGKAFLEQNQIDSANYYFTKVYQEAEISKNEDQLFTALQNKAIAYQKAQDLEAVLSNDLKILRLAETKNRTELLITCYNNLGYDYSKLKDYEKAIEYYEKAKEANEKEQRIDKVILYSNLGITYQNAGDLNNAIKYLRKARGILIRKGDGKQNAQITHLISTIYHKNKDWYNALTFNEEALLLAKENENQSVLSESYNIGALIYQELFDYEKALDYYKKHLALRDSFLLEKRIRQQAVLQQQYLLERAEKEIKILISNQAIKNLSINQLNLEKEKLELASASLQLEAEKRESELALLRKEQEVQDATLKNKDLEALQTQQTLRLTAQQLEAEKQEREIAELNRKEAEQGLILAKKEASEKERLKEISMLSKDKELLTRQQEIAQLELEKQSVFRNFVYGLGSLAAIILALILGGLLLARRANKQLAKQNTEIENQKTEIEKNRDLIQTEKSKSDALLLNILPAEIADELREKGFASPRKYDLVSVLFTDFSGFTAISKNMTAEELIGELNVCFLAFDEINARYGLEKIKTIGDSYMCAGGIPRPNPNNPLDIVNAAVEMQQFMNERIRMKQKSQQAYWDMRIGIHTGSVIAGVVGSKKFAYDIWGDTVNIASRMESNSKEGAINISAATYSYIKNSFDCTCRGTIPIKNGEEVEMFFVNKAI